MLDPHVTEKEGGRVGTAKTGREKRPRTVKEKTSGGMSYTPRCRPIYIGYHSVRHELLALSRCTVGNGDTEVIAFRSAWSRVHSANCMHRNWLLRYAEYTTEQC